MAVLLATVAVLLSLGQAKEGVLELASRISLVKEGGDYDGRGEREKEQEAVQTRQ